MSSVNRWTKKLLWIWLGTMVNDISLAHISYRSVEQNKIPDIFWITLLYRSNHSCKSKCSQSLFRVPQILNAQSEAFWIMLSTFAEYFFLRPKPKDVSKMSFRIQNIRKEQSVSESHVSPSYDFSAIIWMLCPQKGDPFLLCQGRTQETPLLVIACFVTDLSVILDSTLNLSLAPFLIHSITAASSKVCKISVVVLYFSQLNFKKNKKQENSQIQELCISII